MADYVKRALFVYAEGRKELVDRVEGNRHGVEITAVAVDDFLAAPAQHLGGVPHVVVAAAQPLVKAAVLLAASHGVSVGFLAAKGEKLLRDAYGLPLDADEQLDLALRADAQAVDLATCNGELILLRAVIGRLPLVGAALRKSWFQMLLHGLGEVFGLRLQPLCVETADGRKVRTAACGCTLVQRFDRTRASRFLIRSNSLTDGMVSMLAVAPMSVLGYLASLWALLAGRFDRGKIPSTMGFVRSRRLVISGDGPLALELDGVTSRPQSVQCDVTPAAVRLNIGAELAADADAALKSGDKGAEIGESVAVADSGEGGLDTGMTGVVGDATGIESAMEIYTITQAGVALQATIAGTKYWKDDDLN